MQKIMQLMEIINIPCLISNLEAPPTKNWGSETNSEALIQVIPEELFVVYKEDSHGGNIGSTNNCSVSKHLKNWENS